MALTIQMLRMAMPRIMKTLPYTCMGMEETINNMMHVHPVLYIGV